MNIRVKGTFKVSEALVPLYDQCLEALRGLDERVQKSMSVVVFHNTMEIRWEGKFVVALVQVMAAPQKVEAQSDHGQCLTWFTEPTVEALRSHIMGAIRDRIHDEVFRLSDVWMKVGGRRPFEIRLYAAD